MNDREWVLLLWRLMIEFVRAYGRKNNLCVDVKIVKSTTARSVVELDAN